MDYRHRDYYLVNIDFRARNMRYEYFKIAAESLKRHSLSTEDQIGYYNKTPITMCPAEMISCLKSESGNLEFELRKAERNDDYSTFIKINKEMVGQ